VHTIRFVGLPFVFTSGGRLQTDAGKPGMIRFVKMAAFSEVQWLFSIRKAADLIVEVHTIRFVGLAFVFANSAVRQTGARRQMPKPK
jgi:hypothetical protein